MSQPTRTRLLAVIAALLVVAALKLSRPVTLPVTAALFLIVLAWPIRARLEQVLPRRLAYAAAFFTILFAFAAFAAAVWWSAEQVAEQAPHYTERIDQIRAAIAGWLRARGLPVPGGGRPVDSNQLMALAETLVRDVLVLAGMVVLTFAFLALGLAEVSEFRRKVEHAFRRTQRERLFETVGEIARQFRRYLLVKTATSALTGAITAGFCLVVGLDFAFIWGFMAFLLEFVPTIGSIIAVIPPTLFALVQFSDLAMPAVVLFGLGTLQIILGNYVDPRIEGRYLTLSPSVVLLAIVFWGWLWGAAGALLGVPLTVGLLIAFRHFEPTRWIAALLTRTDDAVEPSRRATSRDPG